MDGKNNQRVRVGPNLYRRGSVYVYRSGSRWISLETSNLAKAREMIREIKARKILEKQGYSPDPAPSGFRQILDILEFYRAAGCPRRDESPREGRQLAMETARLEVIGGIIGGKSLKGFCPEDCREYAAKRLGGAAKGHRAVDLELAALSCAFRWAAKHSKKTGVQVNPIEHNRPRLRRSRDVRHCRDTQPANAEELHALGRWLFSRADSQALGWQLVFAAMIGQRCGELLRLRMDAKTIHDPGFIDQDGNLWLYRSQTHKGTAAFLPIHQDLRAAIDAHRQWHAAVAPENPWWFPSPRRPGTSVYGAALAHALRRACASLGMADRTVHGLRSYFVNVLRSQGMADWQIALQIGHKSGGKLIVETYGEVLPVKIGWMPEGPPAWDLFTRAPGAKVVRAAFGGGTN